MSIKKQLLKLLSNLQFAISLLLLIAILSALATLIEQNQSLEFYKEFYKETNLIFNWKIIYFFQLNHIFQSNIYFLLILALSCSLSVCSFRVQFPSLQMARKYVFYTFPKQFFKTQFFKKVPNQSLSYIIKNLSFQKYYLFYKKDYAYAHKGLSGKIAPLFIHLSLLFILAGISFSSLTAYISQEMIVKGEIFHVQNISNISPFSYFPQNFVGRVNNFWITYDKQGNIKQFFSSISILDNNYSEKSRKIISVNHPLKFSNITIYQTDWNIIGLQLLIDNQYKIQIPLEKITTQNNQTTWKASFKKQDMPFLSILVRDLQEEENIFIYNSRNQLVTNTSINTAFLFEGHKIQIMDIITATGLQIKQDYGIFLIYQGFLYLMISVIINDMSYEQIWLLNNEINLYLSIKNNKNFSKFQNNITDLLRKFHINRFLKF
uniref:Cytochrome c biogenesis protein CcsB n=1 Tax=Bangiopsis subsimplex TaxID=139980 RepID=A0A1C9CD09_9RHOD|nr:c-type cytochrome biogenensis protein [Bangiopsis subsimplex]AOM66234.1 c-type cytochrome biogenensis protein [Bangiopsis subsimplex]ARO90404.1 cytochrome c biogenesis protein ccs1 [Bangiopsis subsimplex]